MEVKIKNQNELIDATIEMVDGIMVVSPKEVKWKPKLIGENYYTTSFNEAEFVPYLYGWNEDETDFKLYEMGWVFKTEQECQEFCKRLNQAIENIKP